jgi:hypothetical protein
VKELQITNPDNGSVIYAVSNADVLLDLLQTSPLYGRSLAAAANLNLSKEDAVDYTLKQVVSSILAKTNDAFSYATAWLHRAIDRKFHFFGENLSVPIEQLASKDVTLVIDDLATMNELDDYDESFSIISPDNKTFALTDIQEAYELLTNVNDQMLSQNASWQLI